MIKYIYALYCVCITLLVIEGIPIIDVFSNTWHLLARIVVGISTLICFFILIFNTIGYAEEKDEFNSSYSEFYLRTMFGLKFVPKWPVGIWFASVIYFIQINQLSTAFFVFTLSCTALSLILVQNSLYNLYLIKEAKNSN